MATAKLHVPKRPHCANEREYVRTWARGIANNISAFHTKTLPPHFEKLPPINAYATYEALHTNHTTTTYRE